MGGATGVSDLNAVTKANYLCNEMGMDPISVGSTIACAMELNQRGLLPKDKVGNLDLTFGSARGLVETVKAIANREGIGDELAEGSYRFAERYGHPELSISVKKQELAAYDPRGAKGMGLTYATSNRGACHLKSYTIAPEILGAPEAIDPLTEDGKAKWVKAMQDDVSALDSTGMCLFVTFAFTIEQLVPLLNATTGFNYTHEDLVTIGERIWNLERLYNNRAGLTRKDDSLPPRLTGEPLPRGAAKGQVVNLEKMLDEWYQLRGWDSQGNPTPQKLTALGLTA